MSRSTRLISGSAWNMAGQVLPMVVAVASIPWLIRLVGLERFGFIALSWVLIGYASLFDLGIGRAVIRTMSSKLVRDDAPGAIESGRTGLSFLLMFGLVLGSLTAAFAPFLVARMLVVPAALHDEALHALYLLAISLPFVMLTSGYIGVLTSHQEFKALNLIRALFSVLSYLLPLGIALAGFVALPAVVGAILALRVLGTVAFSISCRRRCGFRWRPGWPDRALAVELLALGGWMSVSNVVGPILTYLDRLLIGTLIPLREVGIYSAPYDLVNRMLVIPYSVVSAYFPVATALTPGSPEASRALSDIIRYLFLIMFPIMFVTMAVAYPVMTLWLGPEVGLHAAAVLQILVAGVFMNAMTQGPATLIQAAGQPRDMALLHIVELPFFLAILWALTSRWGIVGTAAAATLRFAFDGVVVYFLARRAMVSDAWAWRGAVVPACLTIVLFGAAHFCRSWAAALPTAAIGLACFAGYAWIVLLAPAERARIVSLRRLRLKT